MLRLFVEDSLDAGATIALGDARHHYLAHVMRLAAGEPLLLFNGRDGEWHAVVQRLEKGASFLQVREQTRPQASGPDLWLAFAPIKRGHGDLAVEKASELGVSRLLPVTTQRTVIPRVPVDRYRAIAIEASEQCGRLTVPDVAQAQPLLRLLDGWDAARPLLLCAEAGEARPFLEAVKSLKTGSLAVMTGPEGGFTEEEFGELRARPYIHPVRLGPRLLRADTASIAALALAQAAWGDWNRKPEAGNQKSE